MHIWPYHCTYFLHLFYSLISHFIDFNMILISYSYMNIFIVLKLNFTLQYDDDDNYNTIAITITLNNFPITITLHYNHVQMTRNHMALSIDDNYDLK